MSRKRYTTEQILGMVREAEVRLSQGESDHEGVVFVNPLGVAVSLKFYDLDAHCWAAAIHCTFGLLIVNGLAICLRILALYQLMTVAPWVRPRFSYDPKLGLTINKSQFTAAANALLTEDGCFDQEALHQEIGTDLLPVQ